MTFIRKIIRSVLLILWLFIGVILTVLFLRNSRPPHGFSTHVVSTWLGVLSRIFGVRIQTYGTALPQNTLFVSNHISWLDILILGKLVPIHFLSKYEVKTMPVFGWLATRAGTLYIKRGNKDSASEACSEITAALRKQHNSLVFAEGTTTDGHIKKFHSRIMQSAIDANAMVQPVAIFYPVQNPETNKCEINPVTLFHGNTTLSESFNRIARAKKINVEVHFLEPINSTGKTRDEIAQHAYEEVVDAIKSIKTR
ncbi:MAG: 1-acyl-sn-glycerol-3-phosphate acyltransferase [Thiotrichaceae bacterium]|nr:MAG: 1-acyl-sn-glycerol-3-phosphate acyltransferase [Thiotrichaceae bacterium]